MLEKPPNEGDTGGTVLPFTFREGSLDASEEAARPDWRAWCQKPMPRYSHRKWGLWKTRKARSGGQAQNVAQWGSRQDPRRLSTFWRGKTQKPDPARGLQDSQGWKTRMVMVGLAGRSQERLSEDQWRAWTLYGIFLGKRNGRVRPVQMWPPEDCIPRSQAQAWLAQEKAGSWVSHRHTLHKVLPAAFVPCGQIWSGTGHRKGALVYREISKRIIPSIPQASYVNCHLPRGNAICEAGTAVIYNTGNKPQWVVFTLFGPELPSVLCQAVDTQIWPRSHQSGLWEIRQSGLVCSEEQRNNPVVCLTIPSGLKASYSTEENEGHLFFFFLHSNGCWQMVILLPIFFFFITFFYFFWASCLQISIDTFKISKISPLCHQARIITSLACCLSTEIVSYSLNFCNTHHLGL